MQSKWLLILFGVLLLAINAIGALLSFGITFSFLAFIPATASIYYIISAVLGLLMIIIGFSQQSI